MQTPEENAVDAQYFAQAGAFFRTLGALVYTELSQEEIDNLAAMDFSAMAKELDAGELADGMAGMGRYLARRSENVRQDLAVEYARIFLGAGVEESALAVPFESVFTSPDGLLMQDARDDVVRIYRKAGMKVDKELNVPEDHLGFELQFLGMLCEQATEALEAGRDASDNLKMQADFLDNHILNWIDDLFAKVEGCALSPFYPSLMKVVKAYCVEHRSALEEALR